MANDKNNIEIFNKLFKSDFEQCFQQMRHYDMQIFNSTKFIFTGYIALISLSLGIYEFGIKENINFNMPIISALFIGLMIGFFVFSLIIRNRAQYVRVTHYINEIRMYYHSYKPGDFQNQSGMYINPKKPPYFYWRSSQVVFSYIIAFLNAVITGLLLYISFNWALCLIILSSILLFIAQLIFAIIYLTTYKENSI